MDIAAAEGSQPRCNDQKEAEEGQEEGTELTAVHSYRNDPGAGPEAEAHDSPAEDHDSLVEADHDSLMEVVLYDLIPAAAEVRDDLAEVPDCRRVDQEDHRRGHSQDRCGNPYPEAVFVRLDALEEALSCQIDLSDSVPDEEVPAQFWQDSPSEDFCTQDPSTSLPSTSTPNLHPTKHLNFTTTTQALQHQQCLPQTPTLTTSRLSVCSLTHLLTSATLDPYRSNAPMQCALAAA